MLIQTNVGQPTYTASGNTPNLRSGKQGDTVVSELHGRYYEQTYNANQFSAANQTAVTTSVGLSTTYTGLVLSNPLGSTVNLVINKCTFNVSTLASGINAFGLATGFNATTQVTHTTPVTPATCKIGSGALAKGLADVSATLPTAPVYTHFVAATATTTSDPTQGVIDLEGSIVLIPGAYILWVSTAASVATSMWFSFGWEEVPV